MKVDKDLTIEERAALSALEGAMHYLIVLASNEALAYDLLRQKWYEISGEPF